jgi:hypothetical protein
MFDVKRPRWRRKNRPALFPSPLTPHDPWEKQQLLVRGFFNCPPCFFSNNSRINSLRTSRRTSPSSEYRPPSCTGWLRDWWCVPVSRYAKHAPRPSCDQVWLPSCSRKRNRCATISRNRGSTAVPSVRAILKKPLIRVPPEVPADPARMPRSADAWLRPGSKPRRGAPPRRAPRISRFPYEPQCAGTRGSPACAADTKG